MRAGGRLRGAPAAALAAAPAIMTQHSAPVQVQLGCVHVISLALHLDEHTCPPGLSPTPGGLCRLMPPAVPEARAGW